MIVDLHLIAVINGHPGLLGFQGNTNEDARIVVGVLHFVDHVDHAISQFAASPVEQTKPVLRTLRLNHSVLDRHAAGAHVLPAFQVLAVEELFTLSARVRSCGASQCDAGLEHGEKNSARDPSFRRHPSLPLAHMKGDPAHAVRCRMFSTRWSQARSANASSESVVVLSEHDSRTLASHT